MWCSSWSRCDLVVGVDVEKKSQKRRRSRKWMTGWWVTQACVEVTQDGGRSGDGGSLSQALSLSWWEEVDDAVGGEVGEGRYKQMVDTQRSRSLTKRRGNCVLGAGSGNNWDSGWLAGSSIGEDCRRHGIARRQLWLNYGKKSKWSFRQDDKSRGEFLILDQNFEEHLVKHRCSVDPRCVLIGWINTSTIYWWMW